MKHMELKRIMEHYLKSDHEELSIGERLDLSENLVRDFEDYIYFEKERKGALAERK